MQEDDAHDEFDEYDPGFILDANGQPCGLTPQPGFDPVAFLQEAMADADAGRFEDALAKQVWFYRNTELDESHCGIRRSALSYWKELAEKYPPALDALQECARVAETSIRAGSQDVETYKDFVAIRSKLGDDASIAVLFAWLDQHDSEFAAIGYPRAQESLVRTGEYALCGKYLRPDHAAARILDHFRDMLRVRFERPAVWRSFLRDRFVTEAATVVALLAINGREVEADATSKTFLAEVPGDDVSHALEAARRGQLPLPRD
jgi:hypothetical protein